MVNMFSKLMDFGYKRTPIQALGFYIAYLVLTVAISILAAGVLGTTLNNNGFSFGSSIGNIIAVIVVLVVSYMVTSSKGFLKDFKYVLLLALSGLLALFGGALLGLIPTAYLTTK
ncbi:MAG: hypothetical protein UU21_C0004G0025 [Candidatus Levybacteria bacterium GW2011_GWA2_40_8]|nr:MAG: hypothetical protein UU21_C0004G0025 [Candidatus Levybacteria bacterium GW2011_GWA2_40_8]